MSAELLANNLEPPASLKVDVRGLPPRRAELAKLVAWRDSILSELEIQSSGRRDLEDHIKRLKQSQSVADSETQSAAENVVDRIKQGLGWVIIPSKPAPDCSTELQIAKTALARLDAERATKEALVEESRPAYLGGR
jgi:hypothetical protein